METISKELFLSSHYETYTVPDEDESDPGFIAICDKLSGLMGYGKTKEDAVADFHSNKAEWYDNAVEVNVPVPAP